MWLSSADWMPRNFIRRVELAFPVEDPAIRARLVDEILATQLADNVKGRVLRADGAYERLQPPTPSAALRSQERFMALARRSAAAQEQAAPLATQDVFPPPSQRRSARRRRKRTL